LIGNQVLSRKETLLLKYYGSSFSHRPCDLAPPSYAVSERSCQTYIIKPAEFIIQLLLQGSTIVKWIFPTPWNSNPIQNW
jgi:hypothetical protein